MVMEWYDFVVSYGGEVYEIEVFIDDGEVMRLEIRSGRMRVGVWGDELYLGAGLEACGYSMGNAIIAEVFSAIAEFAESILVGGVTLKAQREWCSGVWDCQVEEL